MRVLLLPILLSFLFLCSVMPPEQLDSVVSEKPSYSYTGGNTLSLLTEADGLTDALWEEFESAEEDSFFLSYRVVKNQIFYTSYTCLIWMDALFESNLWFLSLMTTSPPFFN